MKLLTTCLASAALAAGAGAFSYFQDFEELELGDLDGQDGWLTDVSGAPDPQVVDLGGNRAVLLEVPDTAGTYALIELPIPDLIDAGLTKVTVSFDIFRPQLDVTMNQNLWWYWYDPGTPTYGLQWDQGGGTTMPFGFESGAASTQTIYGRFVNITMEWDVAAGLAQSWYDGVAVDVDFPISSIDALTGWAIYLSHDAGTGTGLGRAYIDNFSIEAVPEPATLAALGLGSLVLIRRRRR